MYALLTVRISYEGATIREVQLNKGTFVIGRSLSCDLVIDDVMVSRNHARLDVDDNAVYIEDLGSRNGTYVSGKKIARHKLCPDESVTVGNHSISLAGVPVSQRIAEGIQSGDGEDDTTSILQALDAASVGKGEDLKEGTVDREAIASRMSLLYDLSQRLRGRLTVAEIADCFVDQLFGAFGRADRVMLLLEEGPNRELCPAAMRQRRSSGSPMKISRTVVDLVLKRRRSVLCGDTSSDDLFQHSQSILALRIKSMMCVPLLASDRVLGIVEVDSAVGGLPFGEDDLRLLTILSSQVGIAIENARLHREVERAKRLAVIGETVSGVAHCVKNVLNGIEGGLFIANKGLEAGDQETLAKGCEMLDRNSSFLKTLVLDMLDYSKVSTPEYEELNLSEFLGGLLPFVQGKALENGITVVFDIDSALGNVRLDSKRMRRALLNVLTNAVEAATVGGRVELTAGMISCGTFYISIADTGGGIPQEFKDRVFEPFFSTKGSKGTGLGLAVTQKIIEEHGGKVELVSNLGKGTTFRIVLPTGLGDPAQAWH